jgi:hypothetical protein
MNEAKLSLNMGLAWPESEHLYAVGYRGQTAGRIWFATDKRGEAKPWEWHLCLPMTLPDDTQGSARSKDEALQMLANSLHTLLLQVSPERMERALQLSAAAGLDFTSGERIELSVEEIARSVVLTPEQAQAAQAKVLAAAAQAIAAPEPQAEQSSAAMAPEVMAKQVNVIRKRMSVLKMTAGTFGGAGTQHAPPQSAAPAVPRPSPQAATEA